MGRKVHRVSGQHNPRASGGRPSDFSATTSSSRVDKEIVGTATPSGEPLAVRQIRHSSMRKSKHDRPGNGSRHVLPDRAESAIGRCERPGPVDGYADPEAALTVGTCYPTTRRTDDLKPRIRQRPSGFINDLTNPLSK